MSRALRWIAAVAMFALAVAFGSLTHDGIGAGVMLLASVGLAPSPRKAR